MNSRVVPSLRVRLAGAPLARELAAAVAEIHVLQQLNAPSHCQLDLMAPPAALAMAELGTALEVSTAAGEPLFMGELEAIERHYRADGNLAVTLRGYDALQQLRRRRHLRQCEVVSWRQLAAALAGGLGLEVVDQVAETSVALLRLAEVRLAVEVDVAEDSVELHLVRLLDLFESDVDQLTDVRLVALAVERLEVASLR